MVKPQGETGKIYILANPPSSQVALVLNGRYYSFGREPPEVQCDLRYEGACYWKTDLTFVQISKDIISIDGGKAFGCSPSIIPDTSNVKGYESGYGECTSRGWKPMSRSFTARPNSLASASALPPISGLWVSDRETCKNAIPTNEYYIVGRWTEKKGTFAFDKPTENIVWGQGEFRIDTNTEFGCRLRQPRSSGNQTSFAGMCSYETKQIPSKLIFSLSSSDEMDVKIINKFLPTTDHLYRCGAPK